MKIIYDFLKLASPFWLNKKEWFSWVLLLSVIGFALGIIQVSAYVNKWNKSFYDALTAYDTEALRPLVFNYFGFIALIVGCIIFGNWLRRHLLFRWRKHLTTQFQQQWLKNKKLYRLQLNQEPDNPDQRIAEDIFLLSEKSIDLLKFFLMNVAKLVVFVSILWEISGVQTVNVASYTVNIHGYLVWVALIYTAICTLITHLIGRKLHPINIERQYREADYRANLLRTREYAEQISLYQGEDVEKKRMDSYFSYIQKNWYALINREFKLEAFSATYMRVAFFIPIFATLPMYLTRAITFGDMMQARSAFINVQDGFGWFMDYYKKIIEWSAVVERLAAFQQSLEKLPDHDKAQQKPAETTYVSCNKLIVQSIHNKPLLKPINLCLEKGEWALFEGKSGIGKTTLFRVLSGLWPFYKGEFHLSSSALFLPQQPYLSEGSLRYLLTYPTAKEYTLEQMETCLRKVHLTHLIKGIDEKHNWNKSLSGGEKQKLSIARALLQKPDILCMDEPTSQLDTESAIHLFNTIKQLLPDTACLVISHQNEIKALFEDTPKQHIVYLEKSE